jgi:hypothetical protein
MLSKETTYIYLFVENLFVFIFYFLRCAVIDDVSTDGCTSVFR